MSGTHRQSQRCRDQYRDGRRKRCAIRPHSVQSGDFLPTTVTVFKQAQTQGYTKGVTVITQNGISTDAAMPPFCPTVETTPPGGQPRWRHRWCRAKENKAAPAMSGIWNSVKRSERLWVRVCVCARLGWPKKRATAHASANPATSTKSRQIFEASCAYRPQRPPSGRSNRYHRRASANRSAV